MKALINATATRAQLLWDYLYETRRGYRANPCDVGAHAALHPVGRALSALGSLCACCSGARLLVVAIAAALAPVPTFAVLAVIMLWAGLRPKREEPELPEEDDQPINIEATVTYKDTP